MADLSSLTNLKSTEPLDLPMYQSAKANRPFPKADRYTARTPEAFPIERFGESKAGFLTVDVSPTIVGGDYDGYTINFTTVSAKTWRDRDGVMTSQLGRYLKACGINDTIGGLPQEQADAVERTANTLVSIEADWIAKYKPLNYELKGMKNFPSDGNGGYSRFVKLDGTSGRPNVIDPVTQEPLTIRAFLEVTRFSEATN